MTVRPAEAVGAPIGPFDLQMTSVGVRGITRLLDAFRGIRGDLLVDAYLR